MLRIVIDPGVLIAAVLSSRGSPARLLGEWIDGGFELISSPLLLKELETVLVRRKFRPYLSEEQVFEYLILLRKLSIVIKDPEERIFATPDSNDDYLVALAQRANADFLVSGDSHLTGLADVHPPVITPKDLATRLGV